MNAHAQIYSGAGSPFRRETLSLPHLQTGEALVRIESCTICGSDLHTHSGRRSTPVPTILGHEILGHVEAKGEALTHDHLGHPLRVGDRVVWSVVVHCGDCFYCNQDLPQKCERLVKYGHAALTDQHALSGGLSTHCHLLKGTALFRAPENISREVLTPVSCATATTAAVLRSAGGVEGASILIQGAGMLGLTACAMAKAQGASLVVITDVEKSRLDRARQFGADHALECDALEEIREVSGEGFGVALELSGATSALEQGLQLLRIGGRYVWAGAVFPSRPLELMAETVVRRWLTISGVHNYHPQDLGTALEFLQEYHQSYPFADLVEAKFSLEETEQAFQFAHDHRPVRTMIVP